MRKVHKKRPFFVAEYPFAKASPRVPGISEALILGNL